MWIITVVGLFVFVTHISGDGHARSCFDDQDACTRELQSRLVSNTEFWFGEDYAKGCPVTTTGTGGFSTGDSSGFSSGDTSGFSVGGAGSFSRDIKCTNYDTDNLNIMKRFYNNLKTEDELKQMVSRMSFLDVRFSKPAHRIYACGHSFYIPELRDHPIDPLSVTPASQSSLTHTPEVRWWNYDLNTKYTVIIWDAGNAFLHGMYINVHGGDMSTGNVIDRYSGPKNSRPLSNVYLFIALPQNQTLDVQMVQAKYNQYRYTVSFMDSLRIRPDRFLPMLNGFFGDPVAANLMITTGDVYAAQEMLEMGIYNGCPWYISEMPYLQNALRWANISASWKHVEMHADHKMYLDSLEITVEPIYYTDDIKFESCCHEFSYLRSHLIPDPFSTVSERPVKVRSTPRVKLTPMDIANLIPGMEGKTYTLMLVDFEGITGSTIGPAFRLHWLVVNIPGHDVESGRTVIPHFGANPFNKDDPPRMYAFLLFEQSYEITTMTLMKLMDYFFDQCQNPSTDRCRYHLNKIVDGWNLGHIKGVNWYLAQQDDFARQRIYGEWAARDRDQVCRLVPGYTDPCPMTWMPDPMPASAATIGSSLAALLVAAVVAVGLNH